MLSYLACFVGDFVFVSPYLVSLTCEHRICRLSRMKNQDGHRVSGVLVRLVGKKALTMVQFTAVAL